MTHKFISVFYIINASSTPNSEMNSEWSKGTQLCCTFEQSKGLWVLEIRFCMEAEIHTKAKLSQSYLGNPYLLKTDTRQLQSRNYALGLKSQLCRSRVNFHSKGVEGTFVLNSQSFYDTSYMQ